MVGRAKRMVDLTSVFVLLDLKEAIVKVSVILWSVTKIKENVTVILEKKILSPIAHKPILKG